MIKPTENYILIKVEDREEKTESGIYLPETKTDVHQQGEVVQGDKYKAGDIVIFRRWSGEDITYNNKKYLLVHKKDVLATV
ncbi:MAG: co-chaperone GroES [Saprospiraceae bacterium]|nr:co-chaperone GroES [Saprospiraceae bacterium]MBK9272900.1 co-chaperone GroES [Saprospiraceae bacterium]